MFHDSCYLARTPNFFVKFFTLVGCGPEIKTYSLVSGWTWVEKHLTDICYIYFGEWFKSTLPDTGAGWHSAVVVPK